MPLCHWPCCCYPNHALGQTNDWMNEIYRRWVAAHGVIIVTPVYWYQAPSALKLMIDRLVCADGGNPDPTTTHGKKPDEAKALELEGWDYPRAPRRPRLRRRRARRRRRASRTLRRALSDWLDWMGLIDAGRRRGSTATSATTSRTRPATTRSTATPPSRRGAQRGTLARRWRRTDAPRVVYADGSPAAGAAGEIAARSPSFSSYQFIRRVMNITNASTTNRPTEPASSA